MAKTLKDLYYGKLTLFDHPIPNSSPIRELGAHLSQCETKLKENLSSEEKALLEDLIRTQLDMDGVTAEENFIMGFRLGARLIIACMDDNDGNIQEMR